MRDRRYERTKSVVLERREVRDRDEGCTVVKAVYVVGTYGALNGVAVRDDKRLYWKW